MRWLLLALPALICSTGCAVMLHSSGTRLDKVQTVSDVHNTFGAPVASGTIDGQAYDDYRSHRKIACVWDGEYYIMADYATLGFAELILLPREIFLASHQMIVGQDLRFVYSSDGKVDYVYVNGERDRWAGNKGWQNGPPQEREESATPIKSNVNEFPEGADPP